MTEVFEYASFQYNYFLSYSSFIRCENCERLCFSCNLSALASRFQHSRIRPLRNFFGQEGHSPQSSEVRRFPHAYVHSFIKSYVCSLDRSFIRSFVRPSVHQSLPFSFVCSFIPRGYSLYGYIDMCGPKGYGFSAVLVITGVSSFGHFGHK